MAEKKSVVWTMSLLMFAVSALGLVSISGSPFPRMIETRFAPRSCVNSFRADTFLTADAS